MAWFSYPRESTKTPGLKNDYSKVIGVDHFPVYQQYKIRIWNLKTQYHYISTPEIKNLGTKSNESVQDLYEENYKTLIKKIKEQQNQCVDYLCSRIKKTPQF